MKRVHVLVEGQTEEAFLNRVLYPHLVSSAVLLTPIIVSTKRRKHGAKFKGGVPKYVQVRKQLLRLLGDSSVAAVTTMFDLYGLPDDFPGLGGLPAAPDGYRKVEALEAALGEDIADQRFRPYLSLHEFEALVLASPENLETAFPGASFADLIRSSWLGGKSPEEVNDGPETHPSARICKLIPSFHKAIHGPLVTARIGLATLREKCPHFDRWVTTLEGFGAAGHQE